MSVFTNTHNIKSNNHVHVKNLWSINKPISHSIILILMQHHCYPYWPINTEPAAFGLLLVQIAAEEEKTGFVKREFRVTNSKVKHLSVWYLIVFINLHFLVFQGLSSIQTWENPGLVLKILEEILRMTTDYIRVISGSGI